MPDIIKSRADSLGPGATERFVDVTGLNEMAQQVVLSGVGAGGTLTDAQLRATPVPVSGGLTDAQLRAAAVPVSLATASTPTLYNVTLTNANTEYSQALPANCKGFQWQARTPVAVRYAFEIGKVAVPTDPYFTLKPTRVYYSGSINQGDTPSTVYFAADETCAIELEAWT